MKCPLRVTLDKENGSDCFRDSKKVGVPLAETGSIRYDSEAERCAWVCTHGVLRLALTGRDVACAVSGSLFGQLGATEKKHRHTGAKSATQCPLRWKHSVPSTRRRGQKKRETGSSWDPNLERKTRTNNGNGIKDEHKMWPINLSRWFLLSQGLISRFHWFSLEILNNYRITFPLFLFEFSGALGRYDQTKSCDEFND